jgi:hypothetical protein
MQKKLLLFSIILSSWGLAAGQSKLGDVACIYVTTPNLDSSSSTYEKLGFSKIASNTFPVPWVQVGDGSLLIMMRKDEAPYMGLAYYVSEVDKRAAALEKEGVPFVQKPKEGDPIKRYYLKSPDGFSIMLVENLGGFTQPHGVTMLNMNQADYTSAEKYPNKQCGVFGEYSHPVANLEASIAYWQKLGFTVKSKMSQPYPYAILSDGLMIIGLHQTKDFDYPAITYFGLNTEKRVEQLKQAGLKNFAAFMGRNNQVLKTWEGQHFFMFSLM